MIGLKALGLSLADSGAATGTGLSELPGGCPEDEAKGPAALPGVGTIIGLGEQVGWDPTFEDRSQLMDGRGAGGLIALGSLIERGEPGQGGPRYQWSRRAGGKTVTVALSAEQFEWMQVTVANQRRVWDLLQEMQQATMEYMQENLPHPPRRKRLTKKRLGLN